MILNSNLRLCRLSNLNPEPFDLKPSLQSVDSDDLSAVAKRVFGEDPTCPPKLGERRRKPIIEELNEVLVV